MSPEDFIEMIGTVGANPFKRLVTADELSNYMDGILTADEITKLAENGTLPCIRVLNSPPRFDKHETATYISKHLVQFQAAAPIPIRITLIEQQPIPLQIPDALSVLSHKIFQYPIHIKFPCVYFLVRESKVVYVGQSTNLGFRICAHAKDEKDFDSVFYMNVPEDNLLAVESAFIAHYKPEYNACGGNSVRRNSHVRESVLNELSKCS